MPIYEVTYTFADIEGRATNRLVLFDSADETALLISAAAMQVALAGVTKCGVEEYAYRRVVTAVDAPAAGSNIDPGATFTWDSVLAIAPVTKFPDPVEAVKDGQGGIDLADILTLAYTAVYLAGEGRMNRNNPTQPTDVRTAILDV